MGLRGRWPVVFCGVADFFHMLSSGRDHCSDKLNLSLPRNNEYLDGVNIGKPYNLKN